VGLADARTVQSHKLASNAYDPRQTLPAARALLQAPRIGFARSGPRGPEQRFRVSFFRAFDDFFAGL
jgi:hypothetical protein